MLIQKFENQVLRRWIRIYNGKKYLNDNFSEVFSLSFLFDIASKILVTQSEFKFEPFSDVCYARVWSLLGVKLSAEDAIRLDPYDHVRRSAINGYVVAGC